MRRVFVSYSRQNLEAVTQLIADMQAVGIDTWHDQTLTGGQRWWDNILANIRECDIFVFALSPESWDSEACKSELGYVMKLGKPILPVLVAEGININLLSAPLNEIQVTDYRRRDKDAAFALLKSINTTPPTPALPDPLPDPPRVPISYLSTLKDRIESHEPLSSQDQITLIFELEEGVRQGRSAVELRDLLLRLKRRDDLLAKIDLKIDEALDNLDEREQTKRNESHPPPPSKPPVPHNFTEDFRPPAKPGICARCQAPLQPGTRFCGSCGNPLEEKSGGLVPLPVNTPAPKVERSETRTYTCPDCDASRLIADVKTWLNAQGFDSQQMETEAQSLLLQIKKRGGWRDWVGMATSLNILFHQAGDTLTVEIGAGKWLDKAAVGAVSMVVLWPLAITAGYGAWEQMKMPDKIFDYIGARLSYK
jgi:TIR domain/Double zinc ribbon